MSSIRSIVALFASLLLVIACSPPKELTTNATEAEHTMDSLVTAEWLNEHLDDPDLVILDASVMIVPSENGGYSIVNGRENFETGHIPGAGFADLQGDLSDTESSLGYAVPEPEQFAAAMGALGVGDNSKVVIYDASGSMWAARVWWMLRWVGFDDAALLDGGLNGWKAAGYSLATGPETHAANTLTVNLRPELIVDQAEVRAAIDDESVHLIDALPANQYRGDIVMYSKPGHIPTATNVPVYSLADETGHYKSQEELEAIFDGDRNERTINYCGGGIAASGNAFIMHRLGFKDVAVYTASLQEWTTDPDNPMVTGITPNGDE